MLLLGVNIYSPAGFVNVSSGIGTDLSLISYILLPVRTLNEMSSLDSSQNSKLYLSPLQVDYYFQFASQNPSFLYFWMW